MAKGRIIRWRRYVSGSLLGVGLLMAVVGAVSGQVLAAFLSMLVALVLIYFSACVALLY